MSRDLTLQNEVVLVDAQDRPLGTMEKMRAHVEGKLHRAFSVLLFNQNGETLIQKRALDKYHSGGLWSNTCCSHPFPNEPILDAGVRRLQEEVYLKSDLVHSFHFVYEAKLDNNLTEHEFDHVLFGRIESFEKINPEEASEMKFISLDELNKEIEQHPYLYTEWFKTILSEYREKIDEYLKKE
jgi:isopentenyl-diphosphate delta-isomerase